jgi:hypothetical protein
MISAGILTVAVLAGPIIDQAAAVQVPESVSGVLRLTNREQQDAFRTIYRDLARKSFRTAKPEPFKIVPRLVAIYSTLETVEGLPRSERLRMRETLRARLRQIGQGLARDLASKKKPSRKGRSRVSKAQPSPGSDALGGSEQQNVAELISLIEATIEPDSWTSRGGKGSISYFSKLKVLVVRQRAEVHHQIGGLLNGVRRAQ